MSEVETATGKRFKSDYLVTIPSPKLLFVRILDSDEETVREVFGNPEETASLKYGETVYEGYTHLNTVFSEGDALKVVLNHE